MGTTKRITHATLSVGLLVTLAGLMAPSSSLAGQSMERDGYTLPPESVRDLFRRDKNLPGSIVSAPTAIISSSRTSRS